MLYTPRLCTIVTAVLLLYPPTLRAQDAMPDVEVPRVRTLPGVEDPAFPYDQPESVGLSFEQLNRLGDDIASWVANGDPVGAEVLLIKDGRAVFHETYGWSDRESEKPMERGSIFRVRSMTKPIVGTAILMLVEEGKLALDAPASKYLPSFDRDDVRSITIRELLTQTSGLGNEGLRENRMQTPRDEYESLRALVDDVASYAPLGRRGEFLYHDANAATLGAIVSEVSGMPVEQFIERRILEPLRMTDTHARFSPESPWAGRMNSTYRFTDETCSFERYWDSTMEQQFPFFRAAGGLYSTTMDYARFMSMWLNRGWLGDVRLLSEETVEAALQPVGGRDDGRRYGMLWTIRNERMVDGLPAVFGHGGSDGTLAIAIPELKTIALFFTQSRGSSSRERFLFRLKHVSPFDTVVTTRWNGDVETQWNALRSSDEASEVASSEQLGDYAGTYVSGNSEHEVHVEENRLRYMVGDRLDLSLRPITSNVFVARDACSGTVFRITFMRGPEDAVDRHRLESDTGNSATFERRAE